MNQAQLAIVIKAVDQASAELAKVKGQLGNMGAAAADAQSRLGGFGSALKGIGTMAAGVVGGLVAFNAIQGVFGGLSESVIGFNARLEQSTVAWETMLGSADAAKSMLDDLKSFAAKTPFEFPELEESSRRLVAMGFSAEQVIPLMTDIGNAAAGVGKGSEGVNRIVTALGQMQAKTKVSAQEMMQMTELGIPAWDLLAEAVGKPVPEVMKLASQGKIASATFIQAFQQFSQQNYGDLMQRQSKTFLGAMSTIKDSLTMTTATAFKPLFDGISSLAVKLADFLSSDQVQEWANRITNILAGVGRIMGWLGEVVGKVLGEIGRLWEEHGQGLIDTITVNWRNVQSIVGHALAAIGDLIDMVLATLSGDWAGAWESFRKIVWEAWAGIIDIVANSAEAVIGIIETVGSALGQDWGKGWRANIEQFRADAKAAGASVLGLADAYNSAAQEMKKGKFSQMIADWSKQLGDIFQGVNYGQDTAIMAARRWREEAEKIPPVLDDGASAAKQLGPAINEIVNALVQMHPATRAVAAEVAMWQQNIANVNLAIQANQDQLKAAQAEYSRMSERLSRLSEQLSAAKQRFSDLQNVQFIGEGAMSEQIYQLQRQILGLEIQKLKLPAGMDASQIDKQIEELRRELELLQKESEYTYGDMRRQVQKAAEGVKEEMTLDAALAAIGQTKTEIDRLTSAVSAQEAAMRAQQNVINSIQAAGEALNRTLQAYQANLAEAQRKQDLLTQALQLAYNWLLNDRTKFTELGAEGERIAGVMDIKARELLASVSGAASDTSTTSADTLAKMVANYQTSMAQALTEVGKVQGALNAIPRDIWTYVHTVMLPLEGAGATPRQYGGPVWPGTAYIVGERGPELFVPHTSGQIVPNSDLGAAGNVYVTVNVSGSVISEQNLVDAVHAGLVRKARNNGGRLLS